MGRIRHHLNKSSIDGNSNGFATGEERNDIVQKIIYSLKNKIMENEFNGGALCKSPEEMDARDFTTEMVM